MAITKQDALDYHSKPRPGKTDVVSTKSAVASVG